MTEKSALSRTDWSGSDELTVVGRARQACQDHGARRFIHNNADAGTLGDCGLAAVVVVLEHLLAVLTQNEYGATEAYEDAVNQANAMLMEAKARV